MSDYTLSGPCKGLWKSHAILKKVSNNSYSPVVYLRKPKHISNSDFKKLIDNMIIHIKEPQL